MSMRVGIDIDGVIFPWSDVANEVLMDVFGIQDPGPHREWEHLKNTLEPFQWRWLWSSEGQHAVFSHLDRVYPEVVDAFNAVLKQGHKVHFVTHRDPRRTASLTAQYLTRHFGAHPWAGVHVIQNGMAKRTLTRWDVFVDDKPETLFDFMGNSDVELFAPVRPWNTEELDGCGIHHYTDPWQVAYWLERFSDA